MEKKREVLVLLEDGTLSSEFFGFSGKDCFKEAARIAKELEGLGIYTEVLQLHTKGVVNTGVQNEKEKIYEKE